MPSLILNRFPRDFQRLYGQYVTATTEVYFSSVELGGEYDLRVMEPRNIARRASSGTRSRRKNRVDKRQLFPKKRRLLDIITSANDVKIIAELPGVSKENIKVRVLDGGIAEIVTRKGKTKYSRKVRIPAVSDTDTGRSKFNNGILEITFDNKKTKKLQLIKQEK